MHLTVSTFIDELVEVQNQQFTDTNNVIQTAYNIILILSPRSRPSVSALGIDLLASASRIWPEP